MEPYWLSIVCGKNGSNFEEEIVFGQNWSFLNFKILHHQLIQIYQHFQIFQLLRKSMQFVNIWIQNLGLKTQILNGLWWSDMHYCNSASYFPLLCKLNSNRYLLPLHKFWPQLGLQKSTFTLLESVYKHQDKSVSYV